MKKVRIIKCSNDSWWYNKLVGTVFTYIRTLDNDYIVDTYTSQGRISIQDAELFEEEEEIMVPLTNVVEFFQKHKKRFNSSTWDIINKYLDSYKPKSQPIDFSIEKYNELVLEKKTHEVRTFDGAPVEIIKTGIHDKNGYTVGGVKTYDNGDQGILTWRSNGEYSNTNKSLTLKLYPIIPVIEKEEEKRIIRYVNIYKLRSTTTHITREDADSWAELYPNRIACIAVREGDGL